MVLAALLAPKAEHVSSHSPPKTRRNYRPPLAYTEELQYIADREATIAVARMH